MTARAKRQASTQVIGVNPLEGEQLLLDALYGERRRPPMPMPPAPGAASSSPPVGASAAAPDSTPLGGPTLVAVPASEGGPEPTARPPKPEHYKIVSISLYLEDIERLEQLVTELKRRGHYKANKSQIIRHALAQLDLDRVPKGS